MENFKTNAMQKTHFLITYYNVTHQCPDVTKNVHTQAHTQMHTKTERRGRILLQAISKPSLLTGAASLTKSLSLFVVVWWKWSQGPPGQYDLWPRLQSRQHSKSSSSTDNPSYPSSDGFSLRPCTQECLQCYLTTLLEPSYKEDYVCVCVYVCSNIRTVVTHMHVLACLLLCHHI